MLGLKDEGMEPESKGKMIPCGLGERNETMLAPFSYILNRRSDIILFSALNAEKAMLGMRCRTCSMEPEQQSCCQLEIKEEQPNYIKPMSLSLWLLRKDGVLRTAFRVMEQSTMN